MRWIKEILEYLLAVFLLVIFLIPMLLMWIIATLETGQNGLFKHQRIGLFGQPFYMYKIRTLKGNYTNSVTTESTHKMTKSGKFFSQYKLDEMPQIFNIFKGEMSFVGPRPDVPGYADLLQGEDRIILNVKPGITGPAQIKYQHENLLLEKAEDPIKFNDEVLWPDKVKINKEYVKNWSLSSDLRYLLQTVLD